LTRTRPLPGTLLLAAFLTMPATEAARGVDLGDGLVRLRGEVFSAAAGPAPAPESLRPRALTPDEIGAWLVVFEGPADAWIREVIEEEGRRIVGYVPSCAYLVRATDGSAGRLADRDGIVRVERYRPAWKISPEIERARADHAGPPRPEDDLRLFVELFEGTFPSAVAERLAGSGFDVLRVDSGRSSRRLLVRTAADRIPELSRFSDVAWIEPVGEPTLRNDVTRWVIQSGVVDWSPLHDAGLYGEGQIAGHIDGPIGRESCFFRDPSGAAVGPDHRKLVSWRNLAGEPTNSHGTHTAGTLAGDAEPVTGSLEHRGMAPKARMAHTSFFDLTGTDNEPPSNLAEMFLDAHDRGARVHSNSFGIETIASSVYTLWCLDIDTFTREHEEDLVVFATTNGGDIKTPENAKNVLAVAASGRYPSHQQMHTGGRGPTADGRRKPDLCAPGRNVQSASSGASCSVVQSSGTSMACPAVAGGAMLVREYFLKGFHPTGAAVPGDAIVPTGALVKAVLINSAVDLTGVVGYPSDREGWGRILLGDALYFAGDRRQLWLVDRRHGEGLDTGGIAVHRFRVREEREPLKITLVWTDPPGTPSAEIWTVNDLDLEVVAPNGDLYRGNVIDAAVGVSMVGGVADLRNNVERVLVEDPRRASGSFTCGGPRFRTAPRGTRWWRTEGSAACRTGEPLRKSTPADGCRSFSSLRSPTRSRGGRSCAFGCRPPPT
jgi:subtilisin family serine protease